MGLKGLDHNEFKTNLKEIFKPPVGHAVLLVEVGGKVIPSLRCNVPNVCRGDDVGGRRIYEVLPSWL